MKKYTAIKIMKNADEINKILGIMTAVIGDIENPDEKKEFDSAIIDIIGALYNSIMFPIISQYEELDPDL